MLDRVVDVGRTIVPEDLDRTDPPADLWDAIGARLDRERADAADDLPARPLTPPTPIAGRSRTSWLLAAAAAILVVAAIAGVVLSRRDTSPTTQVVSSSRLQVLAGPATAEATLVRTDGKLQLRIVAHDMPAAPDGSHYELWLMNSGITEPHALGHMTGSTVVTVPPSIDVAKFPVVDISLEPDSSTGYSGHSLLRGTLD